MRLAITALFVLVLSLARAADINAVSGSYADVQAAITAAATGDIVLVPAGTNTWTNRITITGKGIWIVGAGGDVADSTDNTVIIDENPATSGSTLFDITWQETGTTNYFILSGFEFRTSPAVPRGNDYGMITMRASNFDTNGNYSGWRICSNYWRMGVGGVNVNIRPATIRAWTGLIDHYAFDATGSAGFSIDCRGTGDGNIGHASWATPVSYGTTNEGVYFENGGIYRPVPRATFDGFAGARYVVRYNTFTNIAVSNHGTESTGPVRGGRYMCVNNNNFYGPGSASGTAVHYRSGTGLVFSNHVDNLTGTRYSGLVSAISDRLIQPFRPWNQANGTNVWDDNYGVLYESGTHTGTNNATVLVDGTKAWSVNQWQGFSVINLDRTTNGPPICPVVAQLAGLCNASTATTISVHSPVTSGIDYQTYWDPGNNYEIYRVRRTLDGFGQGPGDLLSGTDACIPAVPTTWPNQTDEPCMIFANTGITNISVGFMPFIEGRNWTNSNIIGYVQLVYPHPLAGGIPVPPVTPPSAPTTLVATAINPSQINLTWVNTATNAINIRVERSINDNLNFLQITSLATNETSYADTGLADSTTYFYRLRTSNSGGFSAYSNEDDATTTGDTPEPNVSARINFLLRRKQVP